jgi:uncharacterized membrane protein
MNILFDHRVRGLSAVGLMVLTFALVLPWLDWDSCFLLAWNVGICWWLGLTCWMMARADAQATALSAQRLEPSSGSTLVVVTATATFGFLGAVVLASRSGDRTAFAQAMHFAVGFVAVGTAWLLVHTQFALYYAQLYYDELVVGAARVGNADGTVAPFRKGLEFPDAEVVDYWDFIYYAFTIALCYQTSDVTVTTPKLRRITIVHALISFVFVAFLLGFVVNAISDAL